MDKTFTVQMQSALDSVKVITGYTGRNTTGGIDRIAATNDEEPLLTRFCVAKSVIPPLQTSLSSLNFPHDPAIYKSEN